MQNNSLLDELARNVENGDIEATTEITKKILDSEKNPTEVMDVLTKTIRIIGDKFGKLEIFLPEVMLAADAMKASVEIIKPVLEQRKEAIQKIGKVVIGSIQGDIHDIGKNIVSLMLEIEGFDVIDLGNDVQLSSFINKAKEAQTDIIAASALMTSTMVYMPDLINILKEIGIRDTYNVMVGGGPILREWAEEIGADGYGEDALEAISVAKNLARNRK
jgi:corrinoid protein of di/trimethylamine methyltransferase